MITPGTIAFDHAQTAYEVLEMIGRGGFGFVYRLRNTVDDSISALKTLPTGFPSAHSYDAFFNECQAALRVNHTNVLKYFYVHDGETYKGLPPYLIMEFANQGTLLDAVTRQKQKGEFFDVAELKGLYSQLINGMKAINEDEHLVHRDIKLENILIKDGILKIADFGISKNANEGTRQLTFKADGSIKYTAPERWRQETNTIQNDIYSMGIVFYELATLQHPYDVAIDDMHSWQQAHFYQNIKPIKQINDSIPNGMIQMITTMLEKNVARRYKNWNEVEATMQIDDIPPTSNSSLIDNLVNIRVSKDDSFKTLELEAERKRKEHLEYIKEINYQFQQEIYSPLREFIDEFNTKYTKGQINLGDIRSLEQDRINIDIRFPSGERGTLKFEILYDKNFEKIEEDRFFETKRKVVRRPKLKDRLIVAWGYIEVVNGRGFNLILVRGEGELYGSWYMMKNKLSSWYQKPANLLEPFAVELKDLDKVLIEINVMGARIEGEIIESESFLSLVSETIMQHI
ncbi:Serine/threonine protein kinase [Paenibacillus sophorae]|uniref:mitogen-activated protein kinase kinase n=1 Tax=Paenibacillus sophorae TaxID=1333845 RepID=A0A1H8GQ74_9BACL|nr:serine/threonine-protein kinase [Paenibacillus sophorae]QWU14303.1 serine/threonine protein kinase [Paenibacillus sophorae]SEN46153.1 Serine/threonine protein kinase [Paenibacillus sophorae]